MFIFANVFLAKKKCKCVKVEGENIIFGTDPLQLKKYTYDQVAAEDSSQLDIFNKVGIPIVDRSMLGE
jgi:hypothetical protein